MTSVTTARRSLPQLDRLTQEIYAAFTAQELSRDDIANLKQILTGLLHAAPVEMMQEELEPLQSAESGKQAAAGCILQTWRTDKKTGKRFGPYMELRYYKGCVNGKSKYGRKYLGKGT